MGLRKKIPRDVMRPLTLAVLIIMIIAAIVMRYIQHTDKGQEHLRQSLENQPQTLDEMLDKFMPDETQLTEIFSPRLQTEAQSNEEIEFLARDGTLTAMRISKPVGSGPFPGIVIIHDGESSSRSTEQIGRVLGKELSKQYNAVTLAVDWRESALGEEEMHDVISAVNWIQKTYRSTNQPTILFGLGRGAYLALKAMDEVEIDGLIMAYPYIDPYQEYLYLQEYNDLDAVTFLSQTGCSGYSTQVESCLTSLSLADRLSLSLPTYMVNSTGNDFIPIDQTDSIAALVNNSLLTYSRIQDDEVQHNFLSNTTAQGFATSWQDLTTWMDDLFETYFQLPSSTTKASSTNTNSSASNTNQTVTTAPIIINSNTNGNTNSNSNTNSAADTDEAEQVDSLNSNTNTNTNVNTNTSTINSNSSVNSNNPVGLQGANDVEVYDDQE